SPEKLNLRKAEQKVAKLEEGVTSLQSCLQELEARNVQNREKEEKLRVALVEVERLHQHSVTVGQYLINSAVKTGM
ncbi:hypothetical protein H0H92_005402, partial [Tricholoma furcatifolium]